MGRIPVCMRLVACWKYAIAAVGSSILYMTVPSIVAVPATWAPPWASWSRTLSIGSTKVGADELGKDAPLIGLLCGLLDLFLQPLALLEARDVHELDGEVSAVEAAGFGGEFAFWDGGDGEWLRREELA